MNLRLRGLVIACAAILIGYWAFMSFVPVPADPGLAAVNPAWGQGGVSFEPGNNWANYIDYHFLPGRRWDKQWDPEGLLSSIPAVATALLGVFAGLLIRDKSIANERKVAILMAAGAAGVVVGYLWGLQFPIIKKLWTSSYVLVAGGYSSMLLGLFMYIIDVQGYRRWATPFVWIGSNALAVYLAVHWIDFDRIASTVLGGPVETAAGDYGELLVTLGALTLSVLFCRFLFKRRVFIRL